MCVVGYISNVTVEDLSYLIHTSILGILFPEVFLNVGYSINSNSIKVELLDCVSDPVKQGLSHPLIVLVKVWEIGKSAVLYLVLIVPVIYLALHMIML